ncbi:hypothetical protein EJF36_17665 [Bacillus sp. HMF5848]|uniref:hypothetical protein n=1 Tax=Bacillus sp. HMF5848 TaxID=2495421 RepID=UPI000F7A156C|nr:hypothetical protein [Bacillus sp. HMF5848]RSK28546.1 hypothetical protein EJF36_17665 [Bacillus sp. HMF5848]
MLKKKATKIEVLFWSIALPGFGQLLNGKLIKSLVFIFLEILVNVNSSFNLGILFSFNGEILKAIEVIDYQWLMFYPCLYLFAIWDAYRDAAGDELPDYYFFPFVFGAYFVTVGLIYSKSFKMFGFLFGPIFSPMIFLIFGLLVGFIIRAVILTIKKQRQVI